MRLCVTGGAGYIGSVVAESLLAAGHEVVVVDNLSTGHRSAVPEGCDFVEGDLLERELFRRAFQGKVDAVLHFAAKSVVADSVARPLEYFQNNVGGTIALLDAMRDRGVRRFVFSSSAAVYGAPESLPIEEDASCRPASPYGHSKLFVEKILEASRHAWGLGYVSLRYFNAAGATGTLGEHHDPESHLIPIVLDVALGRRPALTIHGDDYDTPDGTCLRDYIHVSDLADAHVRALGALEEGFTGILNLGSDRAHSVRDVVRSAEAVTGRSVRCEVGPRRAGDPPALLASSKRAERVLGWTRTQSALDDIIRSAFEWRRRHPAGYAA